MLDSKSNSLGCIYLSASPPFKYTQSLGATIFFLLLCKSERLVLLHFYGHFKCVTKEKVHSTLRGAAWSTLEGLACSIFQGAVCSTLREAASIPAVSSEVLHKASRSVHRSAVWSPHMDVWMKMHQAICVIPLAL